MEKSISGTKKMSNAEALVTYAGATYIVIVRTKLVVTLKRVSDPAGLVISCAPNSPFLKPITVELN
jgi:hypothetical protein